MIPLSFRSGARLGALSSAHPRAFFNQNRSLGYLVLALIALLVSGCLYAPGIRQGKLYTEDLPKTVTPGMSQDEVLYRLGAPSIRQDNLQSWEYWYSIRSLEAQRADVENPKRGYRPQYRLIIQFTPSLVVKTTKLEPMHFSPPKISPALKLLKLGTTSDEELGKQKPWLENQAKKESKPAAKDAPKAP